MGIRDPRSDRKFKGAPDLFPQDAPARERRNEEAEDSFGSRFFWIALIGMIVMTGWAAVKATHFEPIPFPSWGHVIGAGIVICWLILEVIISKIHPRLEKALFGLWVVVALLSWWL